MYLVVLAVLVVLLMAPAGAQSNNDQAKALGVLERTKTTGATYVVYTIDHVSIDGVAPFDSWGAEFHSGDLHRIDNMKHRIVANCRERTGHHLNLDTGEVRSGSSVAAAACGVNSNRKLLSAEWLGVVQTRFGPADRVRVSDEINIRTYEISANGALLNAKYETNDQNRKVQIWQETVAVADKLPAGDLFSPESLAESFVPEQYKKLPARSDHSR